MQEGLELLFGDSSYHTIIYFYPLNLIQKPNMTIRSTDEGAELTHYYYYYYYWTCISKHFQGSPKGVRADVLAGENERQQAGDQS